jgi:hypothetical protein
MAPSDGGLVVLYVLTTAFFVFDPVLVILAVGHGGAARGRPFLPGAPTGQRLSLELGEQKTEAEPRHCASESGSWALAYCW